MPRLRVLKTYKLAIGGKFPRGESGRVAAALTLDGRTPLDNYCVASRKDFRDAAVAARKAQPGWAKAMAYLRAQGVQFIVGPLFLSEQGRHHLPD